MPITRAVNQNFFKTWTPNMAYVLGFFTADGSMYRTNRSTHFIEFQITDKELLEKIRKAFGSNHKITVRKRDPRWKTIYRLQIGSKQIFNDLLRRGLYPNKSRTIRLPKVPKKYFSHFLRGYFDGDGCIHIGRYWRKDRKKWKTQITMNFTSGSRMLLKDLLFTLIPYVKGERLGKKTRGYELVFSRHDSVALFNLMYHNISTGIFLKRKLKTFQKALKIIDAAIV